MEDFNIYIYGHEKIINMGITLCDRLLVFVGSANITGVPDNPFDIETRIKLISKIYGDDIKNGNVIIEPLDDFKNRDELSPKWGRYVLNSATEKLGQAPDVIIYGKDKNIFKCFDKTTVKNISEILVDRNKLHISATEIRSMLLANDITTWKKFVNEKLYDEYEYLKEIVESVNK